MAKVQRARSRSGQFSVIPSAASVILSVIVIASAQSGRPGDVPQASAGGGGVTLLVLDPAADRARAAGGASDFAAMRAALVDLGARAHHLFPPGAAIAWLPDGAEAALVARFPNVGCYAEGESPADASALSESAANAVAYWVARSAQEALGKASDEGPAPAAFENDMFVRPIEASKDASVASAAGAPYGAGFWDLSEFMLGDVAISVVLVESNGAIEANTETWTPAQRAEIAAEVPSALNWWLNEAGSYPLTITYSFQDAATGYEPIIHTQAQEGLWVADAMASLGYSTGDYFTRVATRNNALRDSLATDWAVTVFVVNSKVDPDGRFADSFFAYAYLGGPFVIVTYDNDGWGIGNMDAVLAHELGHSFYALDEYATANQPCAKTSGYLAAANGNSAVGGCPMNEPNSIMRSVLLSVAVLDTFSVGQVGWWDADVDGLPNVIDTEPHAGVVSYAPIGGNPYLLSFSGDAEDVARSNVNPFGWGNNVTINEVAGVEWRVDGGAWSSASAADGGWDESDEGFTFDTATLSPGTHIFHVRAINSAGNTQQAASAETVVVNAATSVDRGGDGAGAASLRLGNAVPNPTASDADIHWSLGAPATVMLSIHDASGRRVRVLAAGPFGAGEHTARWDGRDENGASAASGHYFYRIEAGGAQETKRLLLLR